VPIVHEIERTFARGCVRPGFRLVHYALLGSHAHLIVEAQDRDALGRGVKSIGARLARAVNRVAKRRGAVVTDRFHSRLSRTPREVHRALRYVSLNARKHVPKTAAGAHAMTTVLDPASSARWFDGWKHGYAPVTADERPPAGGKRPIARARTWLLVRGWRLHGLLDPREIPG